MILDATLQVIPILILHISFVQLQRITEVSLVPIQLESRIFLELKLICQRIIYETEIETMHLRMEVKPDDLFYCVGFVHHDVVEEVERLYY